jgi:GNAT superfamily N-acetyltransferase
MTSTAQIEIAPATPTDVPLLLALIKALAEYEKLESEVIATEASLTQALFAARPSAEAVVARIEGEVAGFALFFHNFSTFVGKHGLYLEDLFVLPQYRGRAIGKALLRYLAALAVARDCGRFEWAVLDWNRSARDFYESFGAEAKSDWVIHRLAGAALKRLAAE